MARPMGGGLKRSLDIVGSALLLLVGAPVIVGVAVVTRLALGPPVLFRQVRPGLDGVPFTLIKFRTMRPSVGPNGDLMRDDERMTRVGQISRRLSLDELPSLWNVLRGDMSLVGPRPLLMEYLELYSEEQKVRHCMRPGLTGLAQVEGRNALSWEQKLELDVWYVRNWSLMLDLRILGRTAGVVLGRRGVSADGHATMPPFRGAE